MSLQADRFHCTFTIFCQKFVGVVGSMELELLMSKGFISTVKDIIMFSNCIVSFLYDYYYLNQTNYYFANTMCMLVIALILKY